MLQLLHVIAWVIFVGVCVEAGGFLASASVKIMRPDIAGYFWQGVNLEALYQHDRGYYVVMTGFMVLVAAMRALLFYWIIKILYEKKIDPTHPFHPEVAQFIFKIGYLSLFIGLFSYWGARYSAWFESLGVRMPDVEALRLGGADVWIFMGVTLLVVAQLFKRGIAMQSENELTI